jgi:hypothetical protein
MGRLVEAFIAPDSRTVCMNRTLEEFDDNVGQDFIVIDDTAKTVYVTDVTMPLENCHAAFEVARA